MSRIDSSQPISQSTGSSNDLSNLDVGEFLDLLIAELQNQDPLDPMDNAEMVQQISQIREISSTDKLTSTLAAVTTGQNLATASSLIGKQVEALAETGESITGVVDRISVQVDEDDNSQRTYLLHIGDQTFDLDRVREIKPTEDSTT